MICIKSDLHEKTIEISLSGYMPELIQEFGAIIRAVCKDFIAKMPKDNAQKEFASRIALCYVKEIHAAYHEAIEDDS